MSASIDRTALGAERAKKIDWSPYLIGGAIGVLSWAAFAVANEPLGITTGLSRAAAPVAGLIFGSDAVAHNPYWSPMPFSWDYGVLFLIGVIGGSFVSALANGSFHVEAVPQFWRVRFGGSAAKRWAVAFVSGGVMMFGARLAGGCTSGHGLSGTMQLALSSWVFIVVVFASALIGSRLVFKSSRSSGGRA